MKSPTLIRIEGEEKSTEVVQFVIDTLAFLSLVALFVLLLAY